MLGVVIVHYGKDDILRRCLLNLGISLIGIDSKVVIVNNNKNNVGYGAGCNMGFDAIKETCDYIVFMNNDILVNPFTLHEIINKMYVSDSDFISPTTVYEDNRVDTESNNFEKTNFVSGSCFIAKSKSFDSIRFDESFFMYWEDIDLSYRAVKNGMRICKISNCVEHIGAHNKTSNHLTRYYHTRNAIRFVEKHCTKFSWIIFLMFLYLEFIPKRLFYFAVKGKWITCKYIIKALLESR